MRKKFLGIEVGGKCSNRPGLLQKLEDGVWETVVFHEDGSPKVFQCEHEAMDVVRVVIDVLMEKIKSDALEKDLTVAETVKRIKDALPKPDDFRYEFVDVDVEDVEVEDTADAKDVLAKVMGGAA